jgi:hypothetical protein
VGNGKNLNTFLDTFEVIDMSGHPQTCDDLPIFPVKGFCQTGGLYNQTTPLVCGGTDAVAVFRSDCYSLKDNMWNQVNQFLKVIVGCILGNNIYMLIMFGVRTNYY